MTEIPVPQMATDNGPPKNDKCFPGLAFTALLTGFPSCKIASEDEEFPADLNDRYGVFFDDSAEVPQREARQIGGRWNIHKHFWFLYCCVNRLAKHVLIPPLSL
jgi:hypothetical protein